SAASTATVSPAAIVRLRNRLLGFEGIPGLAQAIERSPEAMADPDAESWLRELRRSAVALGTCAERLGVAVHRFCNPDQLDAGRLDRTTTDENRATQEWRPVESERMQLAADLDELASLISAPPPLASEADQRELAGALAATRQLQESVWITCSDRASGRCLFATAHIQRGDWAIGAQAIYVSGQP